MIGVPLNLPNNFTGFIRGEIVIPKDNIPKCIAELKEETGKEYKCGRNLTSGQLNSETANKAFIKYAHFVAYYIDSWKGTTKEMFNKLSEMGFETPVNKLYKEEEITDEFMRDLIAKIKTQYCYECDGVICTMNEIDEDHEGFETGTLNPKASRKVKFGLKEFGTKECEVVGITWQISKNYKFKPVININPVDLNGSTITNITGNNLDFIIKNNICVGSKGLMAKMGDVIPGWIKTIWYPMDNTDMIKENIFESLDDDLLYKFFNFPLPKKLLSVDGVDLVLGECNDEPNNSDYDDYQSYMSEACKQQCVYFCSKLGIDFAGYGNINALSLYINNPCISYKNLCLLPKNVYEDCIGINGIKMYESLHKQVENATPCQLADACGVFGNGIGEKKLQKIADYYNYLPYEYDKIIKIEGWAETSTDQYLNRYSVYLSMAEFFQKNDMWKGFTIIETKGDACKDIKVVFTGIRSAEMENIIRQNGGKVLTSFTKECNLVIAKDPNASSGKLNKAREKGVDIISLEEAFDRYGELKKDIQINQNLDNPLLDLLIKK